MKKDNGNRWGIDKKVGVSTGINLVQLVTIVWLGSSFYTQVNSNQVKNEERFTYFAEQRKKDDDNLEKLQSAQNQMLVQLTAMTERLSTTQDAIKDIRDSLKGKIK